MKRIFFVIISILAAAALLLAWKSRDFAEKVTPSKELLIENWQNPPLRPEEEALFSEMLDRPFLYINEGGQMYAFASESGDYVLKLFKFHRFETPWYLSYLPDLPLIYNFKEKLLLKRKKRREKLFEGYKVAFLFNKKESGLFVVRLAPEGKEQKVKVITKNGTEEILDLNKTAFVIQKKGEPLEKVLSQYLERGDLSNARDKIKGIIALYLKEYSRGLYDRDHGVLHNVGFTNNGSPLHLDVGEVAKDDAFKKPEVYYHDLEKVAQKIKQWTRKHYPEYESEISLYLDSVIEKEIKK